MSKPTLGKITKTRIEFVLVLPSSNGLVINLHEDTAQEDIDFIERIIQLGIEELKDKASPKPIR
jgi:hypothetical protein